MKLNEVIDKSILKKHYYAGFDKSTVKNLFFNKNKDENMSFVDYLGDSYYSEEVDSEIFAYAVKTTVMHYMSTKDSAVRIFKLLQKFVENEMNCRIAIEYPPIPISNTFERLMFIAKYFHNPENTVEGLYDILWVGERTIENDLKKLRGNDGDPIQICGRSFEIPDVTRSMGHISFESTMHPFFLTCNLTQVVAMLKGLNEVAKKPEWRPYAETLAGNIWQQLSGYGKDRIEYVLKELMPEERELVETIKSNEDKAFWSEYDCSYIGSNALIEGMKNDRPVFVEYKTDDGTELLENVRFKRFLEDKIVVSIDGEERILEENRILRSARYKENIF